MPHKERFVAYYIDEFPHFGSASTSKVEGNHHVIKSYLHVGTLHLLMLTKRLGLMLANQRVELNAAIEKQRTPGEGEEAVTPSDIRINQIVHVTRSQVTGWNPLEGFTKSSCGKLRLGGTLPASNSKKG